MSVIRWLVVQEVCSRFEFSCHFESHLARPPPFFICACEQRFPMSISLSQCYLVHELYSQPFRLMRETWYMVGMYIWQLIMWLAGRSRHMRMALALF